MSIFDCWNNLNHFKIPLQPQDLEMAVFIFSHTVESLCHGAVIEDRRYMNNDDFEQEVCRLLLSYLIKD